MDVLLITRLLWLVEKLLFRNWFHHTSCEAVVSLTDRPKSVRNRCVLDFSVGVGVFVIYE